MAYQYMRNRRLKMGTKTQEILAEYRNELIRTMGAEKAKDITVSKPGVWVYVDGTTGRIGSYRLSQIVSMIEILKKKPTVE